MLNSHAKALPIRIVLFRSLYESNVGSVSRVMSNLGIQQLILVDRKCALTFKAQQAAASGQEGLENRIEFANLDEYVSKSPDSIRLAFTCRSGRLRPVLPLDESLKLLNRQLLNSDEIDGSTFKSIDLVFGPEDAGLSGEEIDQCHFACSLKTFGPNPSMNLSHAVLLAAHSVKVFFVNLNGTPFDGEGDKDAQILSDTSVPVQFPQATLKSWINELGFETLDRSNNAFSVLHRMLLRAIPTPRERRILEIVLQQGLRKIREYNELRRGAGLSAGYSSKKGASAYASNPNSTSSRN